MWSTPFLSEAQRSLLVAADFAETKWLATKIAVKSIILMSIWTVDDGKV
jgi:hypothetical protein